MSKAKILPAVVPLYILNTCDTTTYFTFQIYPNKAILRKKIFLKVALFHSFGGTTKTKTVLKAADYKAGDKECIKMENYFCYILVILRHNVASFKPRFLWLYLQN